MRAGTAVTDDMGREVAGAGRGYRYFGRAKELPGVKEMFEAGVVRAKEERDGGKDDRGEMGRKVVDAAYYGWSRDEEDGALLRYEMEREEEARERISKEGGEEDEAFEELPGDGGDGVRWVMPTADEVQEELVDRRRRRLLDKLGT